MQRVGVVRCWRILAEQRERAAHAKGSCITTSTPKRTVGSKATQHDVDRAGEQMALIKAPEARAARRQAAADAVYSGKLADHGNRIINTTDPGSRRQPTGNGRAQGYSARAVISSDPVIIAAAVAADPASAGGLRVRALVAPIRETGRTTPRTGHRLHDARCVWWSEPAATPRCGHPPRLFTRQRAGAPDHSPRARPARGSGGDEVWPSSPSHRRPYWSGMSPTPVAQTASSGNAGWSSGSMRRLTASGRAPRGLLGQSR